MDTGEKTAKTVAENFCTDFISEMKVPDYVAVFDKTFTITDAWRAEWEKGVQVPVGVDAKNDFLVNRITEKSKSETGRSSKRKGEFNLPRNRVSNDAIALNKKLAETSSSYSMDLLDYYWVQNFSRDLLVIKRDKDFTLTESFFEKAIEWLETACNDAMTTYLGSNGDAGYGIEYDMETQCAVCQSEESCTENEILFCDGCDLSVHQGCYGVVDVPVGRWFCSLCLANLALPPPCELCPVIGSRAAMKRVKGHPNKWCHVVCCLWIPETCFQDPYRMDVVVNLENVCKVRRSLTCSVCKQRNGACVQCNNVSCSISYHVTCAMNAKFEVSAEYVNEDNENEAHFVSFCRKHSEEIKKERTALNSEISSVLVTPQRKTRNSRKSSVGDSISTSTTLTPRKIKLERIISRFYTFIDPVEMYKALKAPVFVLDSIYEFWKLKRKSLNNQSLIATSPKKAHLGTKIEKFGNKLVRNSTLFLTSAYIDLRRDMEKLRNLLHMSYRREKLKKLIFSTDSEQFDRELLQEELDMKLKSEPQKPVPILTESSSRYNQGDYVFYDRFVPRKSFRRSLVDENQNKMETEENVNSETSFKNESGGRFKRKIESSENSGTDASLAMQGKRLDLRDLVDKLLAASAYSDNQQSSPPKQQVVAVSRVTTENKPVTVQKVDMRKHPLKSIHVSEKLQNDLNTRRSFRLKDRSTNEDSGQVHSVDTEAESCSTSSNSVAQSSKTEPLEDIMTSNSYSLSKYSSGSDQADSDKQSRTTQQEVTKTSEEPLGSEEPPVSKTRRTTRSQQTSTRTVKLETSSVGDKEKTLNSKRSKHPNHLASTPFNSGEVLRPVFTRSKITPPKEATRPLDDVQNLKSLGAIDVTRSDAIVAKNGLNFRRSKLTLKNENVSDVPQRKLRSAIRHK